MTLTLTPEEFLELQDKLKSISGASPECYDFDYDECDHNGNPDFIKLKDKMKYILMQRDTAWDEIEKLVSDKRKSEAVIKELEIIVHARDNELDLIKGNGNGRTKITGSPTTEATQVQKKETT